MPRPLFVIVFVLALGADLLSKYWAVNVLAEVHRIPVVPWLCSFTYVENRGIAFGLGAGWDWVLPVATGALILAGLWWSRDLNWRLAEVNIVGGLILGGAIGNLVDRIRYGYVIDFLDFGAIGYPWVFNIADSCIVVSIVWIILRQMGVASGLPSPLRTPAPAAPGTETTPSPHD